MTKEQKTEKKARMARLIKQVAGMTEEERDTMAQGLGICVNTNQHALSVRNTILCYYQLETAPTIVGGFKQWKAQGRTVKKGEHGLSIMYPCAKKSEEGEKDEMFFRYGTVFDISQTIELEAVAVA